MPQTGRFSQIILIGGLEALLNQAMRTASAEPSLLHALNGTVVRIRSERPRAVLYVLIYEDGLELLSEYEGHTDIHVRAPLGTMLYWLFTGSHDTAQDDEQIRINGDAEKIASLAQLVDTFNLWTIVRQWLDDHVRLRELLDMLRREDPIWLEKLASVPKQVGALTEKIVAQYQLQQQILDELHTVRDEFHRSRHLDAALVIVGFSLIIATFLNALGLWQAAWRALSQEPASLVFLGLGVVCLVIRLWPVSTRKEIKRKR